MAETLNYSAIGERIRRFRKQNNLTQEKLAEAVGIGVQHVSKIETGKSRLSLELLVHLANVLHTTPDNLLMDNVTAAKPNLLCEAEALLSDCTPSELFVIMRTASTMKDSLRATH
jgi:transcriptional regulator with XRE-family HTH domain